MAKLEDIVSIFSRAAETIRPAIRNVLFAESNDLSREFQERSPIDTGEYAGNWKVKRSNYLPGNIIASYTVFNDTDDYGIFMEFGATPGEAPWYFEGSSDSGKLGISEGKVWAGGLEPGFSNTVGGAVGPTLLDNQQRLDRIANTIADVIIRKL